MDCLKRIVILSALCLLLLYTPQDVCAQRAISDKGTVTLAYLADGRSPYFEKILREVRTELAVIAQERYTVTIASKQYAAWDRWKLQGLFRKLMQDPAIDLIIGAGFLFADVVRAEIPLAKPVVIASLIDVELLGMPFSDGRSGVDNLFYVGKQKAGKEDIRTFRRIVPFKRLHILLHKSYLAYCEKAIKQLGKIDFDIGFIALEANATKTLQNLDKEKVEALLIAPIPFSVDEQQILIDAINERAIPTFSVIGYSAVEKGVLAGRIPRSLTKFARRIALSIDRIVRGENAATIPVILKFEDKIVLNQRTARAINFSFPFEILMEAEILFSDEVEGDLLTIHRAVDEALQNNWNFKIADEAIESAHKDHLLQWTNYLPTILGRLTYDVADSESARFSGGVTPKRSFRYGASLNQLIFSDPVLRDISNARKQVEIEKMQRQTIELDITDQTVKAYLDYLRAKALNTVEVENLRAIETHLETAKNRKKSGIAGIEEVYRWESEYAEQKSNTIRSSADIFDTRVVLNQLMNHTLEDRFVEQDVGIEMVQYYIGSSYLAPYVRDEKAVQVFLEFMVQEAFYNSPELKALDLAIEQQKNEVKKVVGEFLLPEVELDGDLEHRIHDKFYSAIPENDHDDWSVQIRMTYPLFDGGRRPIDYLKQRDELDRVRFKRELRSQEIDRDLRRATYDMYNSIPNIRLSQDAMVSSTENFKIVEKKYAEGKASITDLINARNDKFRREGNAVIALYDFLSDLASFDRQLARYYMLSSDEEREEFLIKIQAYLEARNMQ